ncbi:hypothetical protein JCM10908_005696 [Rhodotorula pacifica]|uniref:uncharacterized protein n=1 Tax=Rhodotorula pacifica TaxID=1495444 RepID=UPI0031808AD8
MTAPDSRALPSTSVPAPTTPSSSTSTVSTPSPPRPSGSRRLANGIAADMRVKERALQIYQEGRDAQPEGTKRMYAVKQREWAEWCDQQDFDEMTRYQVRGNKVACFLQDCVIYRRPKKRGRKATAPDPRPRKKIKKGTSMPTFCGAQQAQSAPESEANGDDGDANAGQQEEEEEEEAGEPQVYLSQLTIEQYISALVELLTAQLNAGTNRIENHPRNDTVKKLIQMGTLVNGYHDTGTLTRLLDSFLDRRSVPALRDRLAFCLAHYGLMRGDNVRKLELADLFSIQLEQEGPNGATAVVLLLNHGKTNQTGRTEYAGFLRNKEVALCPVGALAIYLFARFHLSGESIAPHDTAFPSLATSAEWYGIKVLRAAQPKSATDALPHQTHLDGVNSAFKACGLKTRHKTHCGRGSGTIMADLAGAPEGDIRRAGRWNMQDAVFFITSYPDHPLFKHELFASPDWLEYAARVRDLVANDQDPLEQTLKEAAPVLMQHIEAHFASIRQELRIQKDESALLAAGTKTQLEHLMERIDSLRQTVSSVFTGELTVRFGQGASSADVVGSGAGSGSAEGLVVTGTCSAPSRASDAGVSVATGSASMRPGPFLMDRDITTVTRLYEEWTVGLRGGRSVRSVYGEGGRAVAFPSPSESKFVRCRKTIVDEIERLAQAHSISNERQQRQLSAFAASGKLPLRSCSLS